MRDRPVPCRQYGCARMTWRDDATCVRCLRPAPQVSRGRVLSPAAPSASGWLPDATRETESGLASQGTSARVASRTGVTDGPGPSPASSALPPYSATRGTEQSAAVPRELSPAASSQDALQLALGRGSSPWKGPEGGRFRLVSLHFAKRIQWSPLRAALAELGRQS